MRSARLELRVEPELLARIDAAREDVPRSRWVVRALESALSGSPSVANPSSERGRGASAGSPASPAASTRASEQLDAASRDMDEAQASYDPPGKPEKPYVLPKIAKRKW